MRFFEVDTPQVYLHAARLRRDSKTGKRLWALTLIITLDVKGVLLCDDIINAAFIYLLTHNYCAVEVLLDQSVLCSAIDFFALIGDAAPALHLELVELDGLRLVREKETAELWFHFEIENTAGLHSFVREYWFTRVWARFSPSVLEPEPAPAQGELLPNTSSYSAVTR